MDDGGFGVTRGTENRVEDCATIVGGGKELAGFFAFEFDAAFAEEGDGLIDIESAKDFLDGVSRGAGVLLFVDGVVRDIAAAAACDEDFGAEFFGAIEADDAPRLCAQRATAPDAGEEACGTCADDDDVALEHGRLSQRYAG